jgi:hypothetical protein
MKHARSILLAHVLLASAIVSAAPTQAQRPAPRVAAPAAQPALPAAAQRPVVVEHNLGAHANHPAVERARAYATEHNLPIRAVETGPANRRVVRAFVPIIESTFSSFATHFTQNGSVTLRYAENSHHITMALQPGDNYLWARNYNGTDPRFGDYRNMYNSFGGGGYTMAVRLGNRLEHLRSWLNDRHNPQDRTFCTGNCMEWFSNAEVAPGRAFFHELGIRRSKDGRNIKAKLLHAANDAVDVIGVHVADVNAFNTMSNEQLMGAPPAGGIDDAAR